RWRADDHAVFCEPDAGHVPASRGRHAAGGRRGPQRDRRHLRQPRCWCGAMATMGPDPSTEAPLDAGARPAWTGRSSPGLVVARSVGRTLLVLGTLWFGLQAAAVGLLGDPAAVSELLATMAREQPVPLAIFALVVLASPVAAYVRYGRTRYAITDRRDHGHGFGALLRVLVRRFDAEHHRVHHHLTAFQPIAALPLAPVDGVGLRDEDAVRRGRPAEVHVDAMLVVPEAAGDQADARGVPQVRDAGMHGRGAREQWRLPECSLAGQRVVQRRLAGFTHDREVHLAGQRSQEPRVRHHVQRLPGLEPILIGHRERDRVVAALCIHVLELDQVLAAARGRAVAEVPGVDQRVVAGVAGR